MDNTMKFTILTVLAHSFAISGCSSFSNRTSADYDPVSATQQQFAMDSAWCELEGEKSRSTDGMGGLAGIASHYESFNRVYDACMRSKGYPRKNQENK
jgi:uncharacterized protein YceK